ncbi:MAG: DUF4214 domain-containing protein [Burkholderiales bacterium]|nr:DUF4214 domain-containing protein [Burkholderiales bacterium]
MDKKYLYYGAGGVVVIGGFLWYRKHQAAIAAQSQADQSQSAMSGYLSSPISAGGSTPDIVYSSPVGVGNSGMAVGTADQAQSNRDNLYALAAQQTAKTNDAQLKSIQMTNDLMLKLTSMQNQSQYDLQRQSNQNSGVFSYALSAMPYGGSVNVDTTQTGTVLNINNKTYDLQQFMNQTQATHIAAQDTIAKQESDAKIAQQQAMPAPNIISTLYSSIGRTNPDAAGMAYWQTQLSKGYSLDQVSKGFYDAVIQNPASAAEADRAKLIASTL